MRYAKALAEQFLRQSSFLALAVCLGAFVPAAWAQRQGAPGRPGESGAVRASGRAGPPAPSRVHSGVVAVAPPRRGLPGRPEVATRPVARPGHQVTIQAAPLRSAPGVRTRESDIVIPLELSPGPRSMPRTAPVAPVNRGSIVIAWPAPATPVNGSARPSSPAPRNGIVGMRAARLSRPVGLPRRGTGRNAFPPVSTGRIVFSGGFGPGPFPSANPFFGDGFDFALFGFSPFFFPGGLCPFCFSPSLGLPLLSVNTFGFGPPFGLPLLSVNTFGFGTPFFLPFDRPFFFGRRFFRRRFFGPQFFFGFFPVVGIEAEEFASNVAPAGEEEEDPAILPSAVTGGAPSDAESMAAAPDHRRPRTTLLVLRDGSVYSVVDYWLGTDWRVHYVTTYGGKNVIPLDRVDVFKSMEVNLQRGGDFILDSGPHTR